MRPSDYDDPQFQRNAELVQESQEKLYHRGRPTRVVTLPAAPRYIRVESGAVRDNQERYRNGNKYQQPAVSVHSISHGTSIGSSLQIVTAFSARTVGFVAVDYGFPIGDVTKVGLFTESELRLEIPVEAKVEGYPQFDPTPEELREAGLTPLAL